MSQPTQRYVVVRDQESGLPYSKGLMASSIMATGLAPARAFHVAEVIEGRLHARHHTSISQAELNALALEVLRDEVGERHATLFEKWHRIKLLDRPLIVLVGGATGVGKSTVATMIGNRLGITRVIPTDAIREVMRSIFSGELLPTLQSSSFDAARTMRHPLPPDTDPLIAGFREQVSAVVPGAEALIARAAEEGVDMILEGAHLVPGFLDLRPFAETAVVVQLLITVDDEEQHRSHFVLRGQETPNRPGDRYLEFFENIRKIHRYVKSMALEHGVPVVPSYNLDATLSNVMDLVVREALRAVPEPSTNGAGSVAAEPALQPKTVMKRGV
jgi:2-phosphoglycerate kinase